ncbi:MAG TPA: class IV adenylate cyclase [Candidatus Paceibacterota bacterium]
MKEIEILVKVFGSDATVDKKLRRTTRFLGNVHVRDIYYYDPLRKSNYIRKDGRFSGSFRLRRKNGKVLLTHKQDIFTRRGLWFYSEEHETEIKNFFAGQKIIEALGMKKLIALFILKRTYKSREYKIVLENVRGLGIFLEVEALRMRKSESVRDVKKRILQFIEGLDVHTSRELGIGKAELLLAKRKRLKLPPRYMAFLAKFDYAGRKN